MILNIFHLVKVQGTCKQELYQEPNKKTNLTRAKIFDPTKYDNKGGECVRFQQR